jgi:hypothetical protein
MIEFLCFTALKQKRGEPAPVFWFSVCVRTVRSSIQSKALQKVWQIARVVPIFENVKAEHSATQRDKSLNDPALPLWASTQAIAQQVCAYAAKY